jgi:predicted porin
VARSLVRPAVAILGLTLSLASGAQSSVAIFGIVDATIAYGHGSIASRTRLVNSGLASSRLGFRGAEALGDGQQAGFWLEAALGNDDGTGAPSTTNNQASGTGAAPAGTQGITFNRRSTVSFGGSWGEIRLGRDITPQYWSQGLFDPFTNNGVGTNQVLLSEAAGLNTAGAGLYPLGTAGPVARSSNGISYLYGHAFNADSIGGSGFHALLQYYLGENPGNAAAGTSRDGTGWGARIGWGALGFALAAAVSDTTYASGDVRQANLAGSYDFGAVKLMGEYAWDHIAALVPVNGRGGLIGAVAPFGPHVLRASYSTYRFDTAGKPAASKWAAGYVYNFSRRTAVYATYAHVSNNAASSQALNGSSTAPGASSSGFDAGLKHSF